MQGAVNVQYWSFVDRPSLVAPPHVMDEHFVWRTSESTAPTYSAVFAMLTESRKGRRDCIYALFMSYVADGEVSTCSAQHMAGGFY